MYVYTVLYIMFINVQYEALNVLPISMQVIPIDQISTCRNRHTHTHTCAHLLHYNIVKPTVCNYTVCVCCLCVCVCPRIASLFLVFKSQQQLVHWKSNSKVRKRMPLHTCMYVTIYTWMYILHACTCKYTCTYVEIWAKVTIERDRVGKALWGDVRIPVSVVVREGMYTTHT